MIIEKPPVEMDDTVYFVINGDVYKATVCLLQWTQYRGNIITEIRGEVHPFHTVSATWDDWNKKVFKTEDEAVAMMLKKREGAVCKYDT